MIHRAALPLVLILLLMAPLRAEEEEADPIPPLATDEVAEAALDTFKEEWKAKGTKGDIRTAVRERAMRRLAEVQHPEVTERLYKLTRDRNEDIRTLAVMYLGRQRALPGLAGRRILQAIDKNATDPVIVMFGVDALVELGYRQQVESFRELLRHKDEMVRKVVILAIGDMKELRMFEDLLALAKELKIDKGWKEEGHEVRYDTGAAGDHDQKMAEKIYKEKYGNKARRARSSGRAMRDLRPVLLEAMKRLTGQEFYGREDAEAWAEENAEVVEKEKKALDAIAEEQQAQEEELD